MSFGVYTYELKVSPLQVVSGHPLEFAKWLEENLQAEGYWGDSDHFGPVDYDFMLELVEKYTSEKPEGALESTQLSVMAWVDSLPWLLDTYRGIECRTVNLWFG